MRLVCFYLIIFWTVSLHADGLLIPTDEDYPKEFLRNRMTRVEVEIDGVVARTSVYQEFVNEWDRRTGGVYSFPLPPEARATEIVYWYEDQAYKAVMEVKEQVVNPGTGGGGTVAEVNRYLGRNFVALQLKWIDPGEIQRVRLDYLSLCDYFRGRSRYRFPLNTADFVTYPLEQLELAFAVRSGAEIAGFDIPTHPDYQVVRSTPRELEVEVAQPKTYVDRDVEFSYQADDTDLWIDFYSTAGEGEDGHFALFVRPPGEAGAGGVLPKRVIFLLSNSNWVYGNRLRTTLLAFSESLEQLSSDDQFNIVLFSKDVVLWREAPVAATAENVQRAREYLETVESALGTRLDRGLEVCLGQIDDDQYSNAIIAFIGERSPVDPREIEARNLYRTGIFPVGIGDELDRPRLEMTAALNRGFVTYIGEEDDLRAEIVEVFAKVRQPILANTAIEYGRGDLRDVLPARLPTTYAGSYFFTAGRYRQPGISSFSIAGLSTAGIVAYDSQLDFSAQRRNGFVEALWAKETLDAIEREIAVYGETDGLRARAIALSLRYNLRSRYTAYVADYETVYEEAEESASGLVDGVRVELEDPTWVAGEVGIAEAEAEEGGVVVPQGGSLSFVAGNFPNPFNANTTIRVFIHGSAVGEVKLLKVFDVLGQLVAVVDVSGLGVGWHEVRFEGRDAFGEVLANGVYFVQLQVGEGVTSAIRIQLIK